MATITGANAGTDLNGWRLGTGTWNPMGLVFGRDYTISATYNDADLACHPQFNWTFPARTQNNYSVVHAHPEVMYGGGPWWGGSLNDDNLMLFPIKVSDLDKLDMAYDLSISGDTLGYNVTLELWLTNTPNSGMSDLTDHINVWFHSGEFGSGTTAVGTYSDAYFTGSIYDGGGRTDIIASADDLSGQIDVNAMLGRLKNLGIISGSEYIFGLEVGANVATGQGSLTVNTLAFDIETKTGIDTVIASKTGTSAADRMAGTAADDTLDAGSGNDVVYGLAGNDVLRGAAGNDTLIGGAGNDTLDGGTGTDTASYADADNGVTVSLAVTGAQSVGGGEGSDTLTSIENLTGSSFADKLTGSAGNNTLLGGSGNDTLKGGAGNDRLDGGAGTDTASYADAASSVTVNLTAGTSTGGSGSDTLVSIENLIGSNYGDTLIGSSGTNNLAGGGGNDSLNGGAGNDVLEGGAGNDVLNGGDGVDWATYAHASSGVTVNLSPTTMRVIRSSEGSDMLVWKENRSRTTMQVISSSEGSDTLISIENLIGSKYADTLTGSSGANVIRGGGGADALNGGGAADTFAYVSASDSTGATHDTITGFDAAVDKIDTWRAITAIDTALNTGTLSSASFDTNLTTAMAGKLGANHAILFKPNAGTLSGHQFLVVDTNGTAGYQAGADLVMELVRPTHLGSLGIATFT